MPNNPFEKSEIELQTEKYGSEGVPFNVDDDEKEGFDLSGYAVRNRGLMHFKLAVGKNLTLKTRRPKGCACEILKPPFFLAVLLIGWALSDLEDHPAKDYYNSYEPIDIEMEYSNYFCLIDTPTDALNKTLIEPCSGQHRCAIILLDIVPPPGSTGWGTAPRLCVANTNNINRLEDLLRSPQIPSTIFSFDLIVALQRTVKIFWGDLNVNTASYWNSWTHSGNLEFVAKTCDDLEDIFEHFRQRTILFDTVLNGSISDRRDNPSCPFNWKRESDAVGYIKGDGADNTWALINLERVDRTAKIYDYTIRMNYTSTPYTFRTQDRFAQGLGDHRYYQYVTSGFMTLQGLVDSHFTAVASGGDDVTENVEMIGTPMPTKEYKSSEFFQGAGGFIPLVLSLSFIYPVSCLVGGIVEEKEHRLREGMLIMGLSKMSFYTSWYCTYWILVTVSCILITFISGTTFLSHTSWVLIFVIFELFAMSIVAMSMLISVFFSKSRIAAIAAPLIMFITVVPKFALPDNLPLSSQVASSIFSPVAFSYSTELITNYEESEIGSGFSDFTSDEYSYALSMFMMMFDTILYLALAWYLDLVLPSEFGVKRHPLFFLFPSYWCKDAEKNRRAVGPPSRIPMYVDTDMDPATREDLSQRERVRVMGLRKEFKSDESTKNIAVNNLGNGLPEGSPGGDALTFYEGQIQCVLGHNGAGKTTLINLLTGMLPPTAGDCEVWGRSILTDMDKIREDIGFCPQHNILWARMSCEEHLAFYGRIKGVPDEVLWGNRKKGGKSEGRIEQMLRLVNLYEKRKAWSSVLSGGQKRKLSVACSLIGGSRLVFLDEPTAGMDVESRRAMWSLLRDPNVLRGRVIVLTTHYMDEADLLGDSIAIMNKGCLHSWGSSFFLKSRLGVGYNMSVAMREGCDPAAVERVVSKHITRAEVGRISCTGNELRLRLPMDSRPSDQAMLSISNLPEGSDVRRLLESASSKGPTNLREGITTALKVSTDEKEEQVMHDVLDDIRTPKAFPAMFDELDDKKDDLKIEGFGVSVTTLEEIFMKIALNADSEEDLVATREVQAVDHDIENVQHEKGHAPSDFNFGNLYSIVNAGAHDKAKEGIHLYIEQYFGLIRKRYNCAKRDPRTLCFQFVLPVVFILIALLLGRLGPPSQSSLTLDSGVFDRPANMPFTPVSSFFDVGCEAPSICHFRPEDYELQNINEVNSSVVNGSTLSEWMMEDYNGHKNEQRGAGIALPDQRIERITSLTASVFNNASFIHAFPAVVSAIRNAALRNTTNIDATIVTRNHPLPFSDYEQKVIESLQVVITGIFIMIPFTFIPSNFVSFIVKERECKAKHVQVVSGVHMGAYWASSFTFDLLAYLGTMFLAFIVFFGDDRGEFVGSFETFMASFLLFLLYGISSIANSYLLSFLFSSHTAAQNAVMIFNFIAGFILVIASNILDFIDSTKDYNKYLKYFYRIVPSFCLGEGIISLSMRDLVNALGRSVTTPGAFDWEIVTVDLTYMVVLAPIYFLITCLIEVPWLRKRLVRCRWRENNYTELEGTPLLEKSSKYHEDDGKLERDGSAVQQRRGEWLACTDDFSGKTYYFNEKTSESKWTTKDTPFYRDAAVDEHAKEVLEGKGRKGDYVTVQRLRKVWPPAGNMSKPKVAVADLSFGVRSGELFAFLGTNGAGKTTTLSVLSGEFAPSEGRAFIGENPATGEGYDVVEEAQLARQSLGFCPQFDALLDHMTCEEHLRLFACLRGIPSHQVQPSVELLLGGLGLLPHRKKMAKALSGGNRRKLSVAVALMGGPPVVFLDEPSAGMDPVARRSLWGALEKAITELHLSVVLTTHHLEEIEGLARLQHRVTIMVDGRLQCLGSLSQLKQSLGDSYELTVKLKNKEAEAAAKELIAEKWANALLTEDTQQRLTYQVLKKESSLSAMFQFVEDNRKIGV